jgi:glyoxylase-like metal-dependent hydrolase (beta-lactamase superfamily II)
MRAIDVEHLGHERVICCYEVDGLLVDPGPESCMETLLDKLAGGERPRGLLLTHIHFDHAGASGALVRRWPDLPVYVHERGAAHMADPERLVASARRLYGEDFDRLWGEVVPVPEANLRVLAGGEEVEGFRVAYTPGHASHHVAYLHEASGTAFVGDVAGVRIKPEEIVIAPTPPPDIDVEAWNRSLDIVAGWEPSALAPTHFGRVDRRVGDHLEALREQLAEQARAARDRDCETFVTGLRAQIAAAVRDEETAARYEQAVPADQAYRGLERYWRKRAENESA